MKPKVRGRCLACGNEMLFLAKGTGVITCDFSGCSDPYAISNLIQRPQYHVLDVSEEGWQLQHAITCFPDLLGCYLHLAFVFKPDLLPPEGRWRVENDLTITRLRSE